MGFSYGLSLIDYNSGERTCQYLKDFFEVVDQKPDVIVVVDTYTADDYSFDLIKNVIVDRTILSNYKSDDIAYAITGDYQGIKIFLIKATENLGYARANNLAATLINRFKIDAILFSNSDIVFPDSKLRLSLLINKLNMDDQILGVGSGVLSLPNRGGVAVPL